jgi:uncharacterized protein (DUF1697 family)
MACVVLLRGINVGGHRSFRPTTLCEQLRRLDPVNIGAAGTFVIRAPIARLELRAELTRRLPSKTEIVICEGREFTRIVDEERFFGRRWPPDVTRFVSVLSRRPRSGPALPIQFPTKGKWLLRILGAEQRFVFGVYRRHMKVIGYLGAIDRLFGAPATTRNWNTILAVARVVAGGRDLALPNPRRGDAAT